MKLREFMLLSICVLQLVLALSCADSSKDNGNRTGSSESAELKTRKIDRSFFGKRGDTAVTWLGMAGAVVNSRGTIVFIDPLLTVVRTDGEERCESGHRFKIGLPIEAKDVPRVDAVMYTHADGDHFGKLTAKRFAEETDCKFIAPRPVQERLERLGIESGRIITARDFESICVGAVEVAVTPALHDWQKENPWKRGDCCGYIVRTADGAIWHPGDTRLIDELLEVKDVEVLFFDVAAVNAHLGPAGSAKLAESCGAKVMLAYHYGTFDLPPGTFGSCDPKDSLPYVEGLSASFEQPNPGEILRLPSGIR